MPTWQEVADRESVLVPTANSEEEDGITNRNDANRAPAGNNPAIIVHQPQNGPPEHKAEESIQGCGNH